jgi:hypothetical protein
MSRAGRVGEIVANLALLVLSLGIVLLAGEGILRFLVADETNWFGNGPATDDFYAHVVVNSMGFRDVEHRRTPAPGTIRIALLGDSFLYGSPIPDDHAIFAERMRRDLASRGAYELFNLGIPGANTEEEVAVFFQLRRAFKFDKSILFFFPNDLETRETPELAYFYRHAIPGGLGEYLYTHSHFYYFLETRWNRLLERIGMRTTYDDYLLALYQSGSAERRRHEALMREFLAAIDPGDVAIVIVPVLRDLDHYPFTTAHEYMAGIARSRGVTLIDLKDAFAGMKAEDLIVSSYDYHFNRKAHEIAADYLLAKLSETPFLEQ